MILSAQAKTDIRAALDYVCEYREDTLYNEGEINKSWAIAEQQAKEEVLKALEDNYEIALNDYGFDNLDQSNDPQFKQALVQEIKQWSYAG